QYARLFCHLVVKRPAPRRGWRVATASEATVKDVRDRQTGEQEGGLDESAAAMKVQSRTLRTSILSLAVFFGIYVALLLAVPDLRQALAAPAHADPSLIAAAGVLELLSCAGYAILFGLVFG